MYTTILSHSLLLCSTIDAMLYFHAVWYTYTSIICECLLGFYFLLPSKQSLKTRTPQKGTTTTTTMSEQKEIRQRVRVKKKRNEKKKQPKWMTSQKCLCNNKVYFAKSNSLPLNIVCVWNLRQNNRLRSTNKIIRHSVFVCVSEGCIACAWLFMSMKQIHTGMVCIWDKALWKCDFAMVNTNAEDDDSNNKSTAA